MLARHEYAAMTLDLMLPDQHGIELFRELRQNEKTRELPVVVVSAVADREVKQLSGDAIQVVDWIGKPIDKDRLISAVASSVSHASAAPPHILHVEDEDDVREIVSNIIGDTYRLSGARTLAEAKRELDRNNFDLAILDLELPDGSGLSLLPLLSGANPPVPVLLYSVTEVEPEIAGSVSAALVKSKTTNELLIDTIQSTIARHPRLVKEAS
jgi:DNA-binding response OmpR family regulator